MKCRPQQLPANLVRFNLHLERPHVDRLVCLARQLAKLKERDVRLGEVLALVLAIALAEPDETLLAAAPADEQAMHWLKVGRTDQRGGDVLLPQSLKG
jgi:hypothetical protein